MANKSKGCRLREGDVLRITTPRGYAYAQCTHRELIHGHLIRVFPGFHDRSLTQFSELVNLPEVFSIFILWGSNVDRDVCDIVGHETIPEKKRTFPIFKAGIVNQVTGKVDTWWLWDGKAEWKVGTLSKDEMNYPLREIWNDVLLVDRITKEWRSSDVQ